MVLPDTRPSGQTAILVGTAKMAIYQHYNRGPLHGLLKPEQWKPI
jgi:hypothetical protein